MAWWYTCMGVALWSGVLDPYKAAFGSTNGFHPYTDFWAITDYITTIVFFWDMFLK